MVAPKVLSTSLFCSKCLGVFWFFVRKIIVTKQRGWRAGGVLAAFCFLSKLHRVGANFVKYWCSVYLTGKKENRCQGIICKKNATCGRYSGPRLQDFSASYQIFSLISKKRLRKALNRPSLMLWPNQLLHRPIFPTKFDSLILKTHFISV